MPEVIFAGPDGRLEGRFTQNKKKGAPIAMILHPLPQLGGNMNNPIAYQLYQEFLRDHLAIPVIAGEKTEAERFPGADMTLTVEAMVQDKE